MFSCFCTGLNSGLDLYLPLSEHPGCISWSENCPTYSSGYRLWTHTHTFKHRAGEHSSKDAGCVRTHKKGLLSLDCDCGQRKTSVRRAALAGGRRAPLLLHLSASLTFTALSLSWKFGEDICFLRGLWGFLDFFTATNQNRAERGSEGPDTTCWTREKAEKAPAGRADPETFDVRQNHRGTKRSAGLGPV